MKDQNKTKDQLVAEPSRCLSVELNASPYHDGCEISKPAASKEQELKRLQDGAMHEANKEKTRSEAILAAIEDGISLQDANMRVLYQNQAHRDLFGDHIGDYCYQAYAQQDGVCENCPVAMVFSDGKIYMEAKSTISNTCIQSVEITASVLKDPTGNAIAGIEVARNVTKYKQAEERRKLLEKVIVTLPLGIIIIDMKGSIIYINPTALEMYGFTAQEVIGKDIGILFPEEFRKQIALDHVCGSAGVWKRESVHIRKSGELFPVQLISTAVNDSEGTPIGVVTVCEDITPRKNKEKELQDSEERYRSFLDNFHGIAFRGTMDFVPVFFHGAVQSITGYREEDFLAGNPRWDQIIHCDDISSIYESLEKIRTIRDCSIKREYRIIRKDGRPRWVHELIQNLCDSSGTPILVQGVIYDITERKETEEALKRTNEFSHVILNSMHDAVSIIDVNTYEIVRVNSTFLELHGLREDEVIHRTCYEIKHHLPHPCSSSGHTCPLKDTKKTGVHSVAEHVHYRKNGEIFYVEESASPIKDERGQIMQVVHVSRDITFRKLTEEALRESEDRFRQVFKQNIDALFLFKAGTHEIIDANPAAVNLYGFARNEFLGNSPSLFMEPSELRKFVNDLSGSGSNGSVRIDQMTTMRKDGTKVIVSVWGKLIRLKESDVFNCSFRDITEKVRLEEEAKFIHAKLIQANKMTSLGTLVSGVAHEINNPNNYISFNAQLLNDIWQDFLMFVRECEGENIDFPIGAIPFSEMREIIPKLLNGITEGSHRINNIVNNLKDYVRKDGAGLDSQVDIHNVITAATSLLGNQITKRTKKFDLDLGNNIPSIKGNAQQLEQVIINLITNALQALPDRERGIRITTSWDEEKQSIIVQVSDEGLGMSQDVLDRIPEPFFTTKLHKGGTGLGLSISYSIIKDHQGSLKFESQPGKGTIVSVLLPVR